ncbi:hypothetical protein ACXDJA_002620 [Klebsiella variicola]
MYKYKLVFQTIPEPIQVIAAQCLADVISSNGVSGGDQEAAKAIGKAFIALYAAEAEEYAGEESESNPETLQERVAKVLNSIGEIKCHTGSR